MSAEIRERREVTDRPLISVDCFQPPGPQVGAKMRQSKGRISELPPLQTGKARDANPCPQGKPTPAAPLGRAVHLLSLELEQPCMVLDALVRPVLHLEQVALAVPPEIELREHGAGVDLQARAGVGEALAYAPRQTAQVREERRLVLGQALAQIRRNGADASLDAQPVAARFDTNPCMPKLVDQVRGVHSSITSVPSESSACAATPLF